jgi:5-dehydro-2-deoxygluconokinase
MSIEVVSVGRISIDLYPEQTATPLWGVRTFRKMLGGSPTNVAVAAARLGRRAAVVTKVGADGFGEAAVRALRGFGVIDRFVGRDPALRTPLAFCEIYPPDHFPLLFYRQPTAPDMTICDADLPDEAVVDPAIFWVTAAGLAEQPSRDATLRALQRRGRRGITVLDLDYRSEFWRDGIAAGPLVRRALGLATVAVGNLAEVATAVGEFSPTDSARAMLGLGVGLAVVKMGPAGVLAATAAGQVCLPPVLVDVVNGLGAGDAFGGALCHGLLSGWSLQETIGFANAAGALVASRLGCADDMPAEAEVLELLARHDLPVPAGPPSRRATS